MGDFSVFIGLGEWLGVCVWVGGCVCVWVDGVKKIIKTLLLLLYQCFSLTSWWPWRTSGQVTTCYVGQLVRSHGTRSLH